MNCLNIKYCFQIILVLVLGTKPWYIGWSNCQDSAALEMRSLYSRPYFLPKTSGEPTATDWIFMGGPGKGAHLHVSENLILKF